MDLFGVKTKQIVIVTNHQEIWLWYKLLQTLHLIRETLHELDIVSVHPWKLIDNTTTGENDFG